MDSIAGKVPISIRPVARPRIFGLIIIALEDGPASAETIICRLQTKGYKFYPNKRQISSICSKYKTVFDIDGKDKLIRSHDFGKYDVIRWKLRDDINVVD